MRFIIKKPRTIFHDTTWHNPVVKIEKLGSFERVLVEFEDCMVTMYFENANEAIQVLNNIIRQIEAQEKKK